MKCVICNQEVDPGREHAISDEEFLHVVVHSGECYKRYVNEELYGEQAIKRGIIIGLCSHCGKPVRREDVWSIGRIGREDFDCTLPGPRGLCFQHDACEPEYGG